MSDQSPHYTRAPIVETLIDFRVAWPNSASIEDLRTIAGSLSEGFPKIQNIEAVEMQYRTDPGQKASFDHRNELVGLRLDSASGHRVLQLQRTGFTYSHLPPYSRWSEFRSEAVPLWERYVENCGIDTVTRAAIRTINKYEVECSSCDVSSYLSIYPRLPDGFPGTQQKYFMQFQQEVAVGNHAATGIVNCGAKRVPSGKLELLFDFDVFVLTTMRPGSNELWPLVDGIHDLRNRFFEATVTDLLRKEIE